MAVWDSDAAKRQKKILNRFDPPALDDDDDFWPRRPRRDPFRKDRYVAITLSIAVLLIGGVVWYFAPLRPKAVKTMPSARGNLWLIGYAIQLYHKENGQLPPAFIRDESGKPAHSWRVIILPYLARVDHD